MSKSKEDIQFDEHIRNEYANHGVTPPENLWLAIDSKASQLEALQLKKRAIFYKWLALSIFTLLIGVSSLYFYELNIHEEQLSLNSNANKSQNFTNKIASKKKSSTTILETNTITANNKTVRVNNKTPLVTTTEENTNSIKNNQLKDAKIPLPTIVKQPTITKKSRQKTAKIFAVKNKKETITTNAKSTSTKESLNQTNKKTIAAINNIQQIVPTEASTQPTIVTSKREKESFTNSKMNAIVPLAPNFALLAGFNTAKTPNTKTNFPPVAIIPTKILSRISVSAYISPSFSSRFLKGSSASFYNKNQKGNLVYNGGLDLGYNLTDKWTIRVGANYSQLNQTINLNNSKSQNLPINIDTTDNIITVFSSLGTVKAEDLEELELDNDHDNLFNFKETHNFKFINIPVFMAYELGKRKLKFVFQLGGEVNFTIKNSSGIEILNAKNFNTIKLDVLTKTTTVNFSGFAAVGAKYLLTKRISLIVMPTYTMFFTNLSKENTNKITPYSLGVSTGLQYHF